MRSIVKLKCINSIIDGSSLVCLVKKLTSMEASSTAALETVIIDCCSGVTREDCDAIRRLVKKMKVYA
ncbi:hypothetical protein M408DRAFT_299763 [Serendipita vermifera MAFF 305830]|uniref:Uncharacterized protein n=1 Tax=Serendipita vermifera MAFF 305830 TaxID=933852 RepID=A0A0C3ARI2_SERVB|nr:hypothetical protein M408DRAFT_299763 [Serendipita vermifera MAFF 305830]